MPRTSQLEPSGRVEDRQRFDGDPGIRRNRACPAPVHEFRAGGKLEEVEERSPQELQSSMAEAFLRPPLRRHPRDPPQVPAQGLK